MEVGKNKEEVKEDDDEVEEEKEELDEVNVDTKDEGVLLTLDSVVILITALTVFLSQRSGLSFNIISISNDEGSICFLQSFITFFEIELVCPQIEDTGVT